MQRMGCSRSLFARFKVACRVGQFNVSRPATCSSYPNNMEGEDYFKSIPAMTPEVRMMSRRGFQGGRALAERSERPIGPLKPFEDLMGPDYQKHTQLTDGSQNHEQVGFHTLRWCNLFLFFSSLDTCDSDHIKTLELVHKESQRVDTNCKYNIVWIPVMEEWTEKEEKDFDRLRSRMLWYTAKCSCLRISDVEKKWNYKGKPILVVIDTDGKVKNENALEMIWKKGITAFPFQAAGN